MSDKSTHQHRFRVDIEGDKWASAKADISAGRPLTCQVRGCDVSCYVRITNKATALKEFRERGIFAGEPELNEVFRAREAGEEGGLSKMKDFEPTRAELEERARIYAWKVRDHQDGLHAAERLSGCPYCYPPGPYFDYSSPAEIRRRAYREAAAL